MTEKEFAAWMGKLAHADMVKSGVLASVSTAQAILESGYGTTDLAKNANNFFGMKCTLSGNTWAGSTWDGVSKYRKKTGEDDGTGRIYYVTADFRKYAKAEDSVADHSAYLLGAKKGTALRYEGLKGEKDPEKAIKIIKGGGYATDTNYVSKILDIIERFGLTQYDSAGDSAQKESDNMGINIIRKYITTNNSNSENDPRYIIIHNTDNFNKGADALAHASGLYHGYMENMSWHYVTDDHSIYQCINHNRGAWHVGVNYGSNNLFGTVNNRNSICIEMCVNKGYDYEKAFKNTVNLTKYLMKMLNIPADRVLQHWDVCSKNCPSQIRAHGDWARFKRLIGDSTSVEVKPSTAAKYPAAPFNVEVLIDDLNIRKRGSTAADVVGQTGKGNFIISKRSGDWGKLQTGAGWIYIGNSDWVKIGKKVPKTKKTTKYFKVQTGAYGAKANADADCAKVKAAGFDAFVTPKVDGYYRVQVGSFGSKANAEAMQEQIKKAGFDAIIKEY